jgi:capsular polysaccharide biosynthesis protein
LEEARIADEMNRQKMAYVTVINPADIPVKPISPKRVLNIILAIIFGMASGVGLAFVREYISQGISTPTQAERPLGLKVLVCVPYNRVSE